jgi:hypothetical protein
MAELFDVSQPDLDAALEPPATYTNRIVALNTSAGMRISFGELGDAQGAPVFRSAILLSYEDAAALRHLIDSQLNKYALAAGNWPNATRSGK